jgi:signal transduction histidine kinase
MCVPMRGGDGILGAMMLVTAESGRTYTDLDLNLAEELGRRAGAAITNARLYRDSQAAREELARSNQAKDEFLGILAHELRTPLTSIFGGARLLNNKSRNLPDRARADLLETIETEASKMTRLIENLLLLARTEMGKAPDTQKFSLQDLVVRVAADIHTSRPDRLILFDDQTLPPIWSDPTRLEQVIYNLISNADKYSPLAEPIEVKINLRPDSVTVRVLDRGPGASPAEINLLFESFYRSSATAGSAPGKGIGLAVCRRLVESLNGSIWARNRRGGGLEAGFSVPIEPPVDNADEAVPSRLGLSSVAAN